MLKYIAVITMIVDHAAHLFVYDTVLYMILRCIGRCTMPIMAYFAAEGWKYTHDRKKYMKRLLIFGLVSSIPYSLCFNSFGHFSFSAVFTLWLGLAAVDILESQKDDMFITGLKLAGVLIFAWMSDWSFYCVGFVLVFRFLRKKPFQMWLAYAAVCFAYMLSLFVTSGARCFMAVGCVIPALLLCAYNHKRETGKPAWEKWLFYYIYPVHLVILYFIKLFAIGV